MSAVYGKPKGFTLIELLVVIAIIAILAAILFPVFMSAKAKARESGCISNLKQIGSATTMYLDDNGNRFPLLEYGDHSESTWWKTAVAHYIANNKNVWICASQIKGGLAHPSAVGTRNSYGVNFYYMCGTLMSRINHPTATVYVCEGAWNDARPPAQWDTFLGIAPPAQTTYQWITRPPVRHGGGCAVLFADGHAKIMARQRPFYPPVPWAGNNIWDNTKPNYENEMWDLD
jgi:prepilin-type N-terminal cleavage/methylation domain-containing protein/prepilin-type processing-associated H-X9-DG protein